MLNIPFKKGANAGKTLSAPTSPFARFRSKAQPGPRPGLPSVIGNLFQGAASDQPTQPGALAGLMQNGIAGAGQPHQVATETPGMFPGTFPNGGQPDAGGGLMGIMQRLKARQAPPMAPQMPPMPPTGGGY